MSIPSEQPPETGRGEPDRHKARGTEAAGATDAPQDAPQAASAGRVPQSQRPGGKKRKVALYVAFVGAGYSVSAPVNVPLCWMPVTALPPLSLCDP